MVIRCLINKIEVDLIYSLLAGKACWGKRVWVFVLWLLPPWPGDQTSQVNVHWNTSNWYYYQELGVQESKSDSVFSIFMWKLTDNRFCLLTRIKHGACLWAFDAVLLLKDLFFRCVSSVAPVRCMKIETWIKTDACGVFSFSRDLIENICRWTCWRLARCDSSRYYFYFNTVVFSDTQLLLFPPSPP